jgi:hypothetical protein
MFVIEDEAHAEPQEGQFRTREQAIAELEHDPEKWIPVFGKDHAQT